MSRRGITTIGVAVVVVVGLVLAVAGCGGPAGSESVAPSASGEATVGGESERAASGEGASARYVHLGDSYAAGAGVTPLGAESDLQCLRSQRNFGEVVAARLKSRYPTFADVSCAGASSDDLFGEQYPGIAAQLDALGAQTELVTVMLGGNDGAIFSSSLADCSAVAADDATGAPCRARHGERFAEYITTATRPALSRAFAAIRDRAPSARVIVVGYPWILPAAGGCYPTMRVAVGDVGYLRGVQAALNAAVRDAARRAGATFVSMDAASTGHDACAGVDRRWIEPMSGARTTVPVHPNVAGQRALAAATLRALGS